jgi:cyclopropane fatty-acyl-phospholipid synthase-like methyltransferase
MTNDYSPDALNRDLVQSEQGGESMRDWWDRAQKRDHLYWLGGKEGPDVWRRLQVEDRIRPRATVLNVGVGLGICTAQLVEHQCTTDVLDISPGALARVAGKVRQTYLASNVAALPANEYDVAISHLVAQHMMDDDLREQIRWVVRSLKADGLFAIQFATSKMLQTPDQSSLRAKGGGILRSPKEMAALASGAGARVVLSVPKEQFEEAGWHVVQLGKA